MVWKGTRRLLVGGAAAAAIGSFSGPLCCQQALAMAPGESESGSPGIAAEPDAGSPTPAPFTGNAELKARLDAPGKLTVAGERLHDALLRRFYTAHGYETVWDNHRGEATQLRNEVLRAADHGLDPGLFHGVALVERAAALSPVERDLLMSDAFLAYADALSRGAVPIEDRADDEDLTPEPVDIIAVVGSAIASPNPAKMIEALAPSSPEYMTMRRALAEYRGATPNARNKGERGNANNRAAVESRVRQLTVALERLRWLPRHMPPDRVVVNAAIARLQLFHDDRPVFTTRVVVGETDKQTPEFQAGITSLLYNPPWNIPRSIAQKEILPKLAADPGYLSQHHMRFRSGAAIQQEPGPGNALGQLKFEMPNRYDVYMHDTPTKSLFSSAARMMSHGCVRVENPRALAALLLGGGVEAINKGIALGYTNRRSLANPLPVFILYQTAFVESDGSIQFRSDPYERDDEIWQHLTRSQAQPLAQDGAAGQRKG